MKVSNSDDESGNINSDKNNNKLRHIVFPQGLLLMLTMLTVPGACRAAIYEQTGRYVTTGGRGE